MAGETLSVDEIRRRKGYMRSRGMKWADMENDSWGPGQNAMWKKATTREKTYQPTIAGLVQKGWDKLTGNTTYQTDYPEGEIRQGSVAPKPNLAGAAAVSAVDPRVAAGLGAAALTVVPLLTGREGYNEAMGALQSGADRIKRGAENTYRRVTGMFTNSNTPANNNSGGSGGTNNGSNNAGSNSGTNTGTNNGGNAGTQQPAPSTSQPAASGTQAGSGSQPAPAAPNPNDNDEDYKRRGWQPLNERRRFWSFEHPVRYARQYPGRAVARTAGAAAALTTYPAREYLWPNVVKLWTGPSVPGDSLKQSADTTKNVVAPVENPNDHIINGYIAPTDTIHF